MKLWRRKRMSIPFSRASHFSWRAQAGISTIRGVDWIAKKGSPYLEQVYAVYKSHILQLEAKRLPIPVIIRPSVECEAGITGVTWNGELNYCAGQWASNEFCYGVLAHELCNLLTAEGVSPGWPTAWWANHQIPISNDDSKPSDATDSSPILQEMGRLQRSSGADV